jgi:hypothetical protein
VREYETIEGTKVPIWFAPDCESAPNLLEADRGKRHADSQRRGQVSDRLTAITDQVDPWRTVSLAANAPSFPLCYL